MVTPKLYNDVSLCLLFVKCQNGVLGRTKVQTRARQQHVVKVFNSLFQRLPNEAKTLQVQTISRRSKNSRKYTLQEHGNTKNIVEGSERKEPEKNNQNQRAYKQRDVRYVAGGLLPSA
ncbi:hypothetical protein ILYODFUR_032446 [Ilyodon furcidens]|uniref:Uncharacterized protein n=1 Tax=Ilyodon furcidens TaxID=33524 RepID=A0ABV0UYF3_9TELE